MTLKEVWKTKTLKEWDAWLWFSLLSICLYGYLREQGLTPLEVIQGVGLSVSTMYYGKRFLNSFPTVEDIRDE